MERYAPRHPADRSFVQEHAPKFKIGPAKEEVRQPKTLVDFYLGGDYRRLHSDMLSRPDHYTERQKAIITAKVRKQPLSPEPTEQEVNGLVEQLTRSTEVEKKHQEIVQKVKDIADEAELITGDGSRGSYEEQDFGDLIKII